VHLQLLNNKSETLAEPKNHY